MILTVIAVYFAIVLFIGLFSHKLFRGTGDDFFVAERSIGSFVLFLSLFGTHMTAFTLLGASGESYHHGIGVFSLMASSSALMVPAVFYFVGLPLWSVGKKHGYVTQVQYFRERWNSPGLGLLLFGVLNLLLIPYLLIGVMGGALTLSQMTENTIPYWMGGLLVCGVVMVYVLYGGMRSTAWVNSFQTLVFMICGGLTLLVILKSLGGLRVAMTTLEEQRPDLLIRGNHIAPMQLFSYMFIPLSAGMFPHLFNHWLTARRAQTFRMTLIVYPLAIAAVWVPSVLLGVLGAIDFPNLRGPEASSVLIRMIGLHAPTLLAGILAAGVISSVMNSLDSQSLAVGSMFTQDIMRQYLYGGEMTEQEQVRYGRIFVAAILMLSYLLSLVAPRSIFGLGVWAFTGFASLLPVALAAIYWKRSTKHGAIASILSVAVLWLYFFLQSKGAANYTVGGTGLMPVVVMFLVSSFVMVLGSLLTTAPEERTIRKFFPGSVEGGSRRPQGLPQES